MLCGEGNAGERWKTAIGLISKKATLHVQHTFFYTCLCRCFARLQRETSRKLLSYTFYGGDLLRVLVHGLKNLYLQNVFFFLFFFFTTAYFHLASVAASISHFVTAARKLSCCSSNKKCLLCFLSFALYLRRPFSRWASLACRLIYLFLCLSLALYSKFVDMTINLSLIL